MSTTPNQFRVLTSRPLLVAIGPSAAFVAARCVADLDGVDAISVEAPLSADGKMASLASVLCERSAIVCCLDAHDESFWKTADAVIAVAHASTPLLCWLCTTGGCDSEADVSRFLKLARHLRAAVLVAPSPSELLATALVPLNGLVRPGLTGFDPTDLAAIFRPPSVGFARFGDAVLGGTAIMKAPDALVISIGCHPDSEVLRNINAVSERISDRYPEASAMVASFLTGCGPGETVDVGLLEIYSSAM